MLSYIFAGFPFVLMIRQKQKEGLEVEKIELFGLIAQFVFFLIIVCNKNDEILTLNSFFKGDLVAFVGSFLGGFYNTKN